ncbi:MAG: type I-C CRISPR-associated protein Cas7/Csd2 [Bacteroidales bacterium]|uniref:type I-C CRISPR-associated protein Cas7/Csd2 n=1 Tax=Candidatus Cryptobacteroides sp. TaxID=2952915 RepID=UPI002A91FE07|nr:type I-C CRISPR-associated protein Cas7/Csd2 [Candidatus Cryptobacteroides sp.]MDD7135990.1 type I-C CRISPR-associated protein Cas7/Csd2 [Bacteroidales bacterium]MDY5567345.1 type I-C CRISPR-associated protein Cas7/Csd2 [Candidatus Cryptobacteroides sp.]
MTTIKNRYDFVFLFDVKDGNPNGDPDFDNMPRTDEETNQGLVTDVCIKRKVRNYVQLLKGLESPYDIFIREGNVLNLLINEKRNEADKEDEDEKKAVAKGRMKMCEQYYDIRTFGAVMSTGEEKEDSDSTEDVNADGGKDKKNKKKESKKKIKGLGVVRGPVQLTFARSIDPVDAKSHTLTRCCVTNDNGNNNTMGNKNTVSYGLYRMHGFISATDAAKTGFSEEDKELLFEAIINAFENDHAAARGEMNPRALIVFKHESPLGNARAGQLFDLVKVEKKEGIEYPRSFGDYIVSIDKCQVPATIEVEELIK